MVRPPQAIQRLYIMLQGGHQQHSSTTHGTDFRMRQGRSPAGTGMSILLPVSRQLPATVVRSVVAIAAAFGAARTAPETPVG